MRNHSYENDFDLHENETARRTHFHMKGLALRLVLKQRHKRTRKRPIGPQRISNRKCPQRRPQMIPPVENVEWHGISSSGRGFNF